MLLANEGIPKNKAAIDQTSIIDELIEIDKKYVTQKAKLQYKLKAPDAPPGLMLDTRS